MGIVGQEWRCQWKFSSFYTLKRLFFGPYLVRDNHGLVRSPNWAISQEAGIAGTRVL
ncbi:hypothetical protein ASPCADRAFT_202325 [Aspergillus carbonarius ITEM 5010]|uniref:Uncharacterized protein n=1 Tax=Aspergillus carbonarius (strain ITEM 5010) TaxID=602072 RepID=A0A1R3S157_ASPC5|nr:hypothetical protein ASPCADRAFT_202325 [Aspergillus carbonarius ITEM 5010]